MLHTLKIKYRVNTVQAERPKNHQQMAVMGSSEAPDVMAELLLDIACQNKFTPVEGLGFPYLHHKPHYNTLIPLKGCKLETVHKEVRCVCEGVTS